MIDICVGECDYVMKIICSHFDDKEILLQYIEYDEKISKHENVLKGWLCRVHVNSLTLDARRCAVGHAI